MYDRLRKTNNYLSWTLAAILRHPQIIAQCLEHNDLRQRAQKLQTYHFEKQMNLDSTEHAMFSLTLTSDEEIESQIPKREHLDQTINGAIQEHYRTFSYPYDIEKSEKIAVTKLQNINDDHYVNMIESEDSIISAADKGTLIHLLMSYLTFRQDNISALIEQLYDEELINDIGKDILIHYQDKIQAFIESSYYQMIQNADYIYKEKSFSYYDQKREQVIHGIFDLVFIYQDQVYVLDYKTDRVSINNSKQVLIDKHKTQLDYYKKVLNEMYQKDTHAIVYYLQISTGVEF